MRMIVEGPGDVKGTGIGEAKIKDLRVMQYRTGKVFVRYLFEDLIRILAEDMVKNVHDGFDNIVVIQGPEGSGKSNLAYYLASAYEEARKAPAFDMTKQYVYDTEAFSEKLKEGQDQRGTFWMDEGSNIANNRDWQSDNNKNLIALLEMMRSRGWTLIFCIPHHERLDKYIREHRMRYLITCSQFTFDHLGTRDRGFFEVKKRNPFGYMSTVGYGEYDVMPPEKKEIYEKLKLDAQEKKIKSVVEPEGGAGAKYKGKYEAKCKEADIGLLLAYNAGAPMEDLMHAFHIESPKTFYNRLSKARKHIEEDDT